MSSGPPARKPKPRSRVGELERAQAEVQEDAVDGPEAGLRRDLAEGPEVRLPQDEPVAEPGEPLPHPRDRGGVGVEPEDAAVRAGGFQDPLGVPTAADGAVDVEAAGARGEHLDDLLREHRPVPFLHVISTIDERIPSGPWKRM